jgi:hypothetical protein
MFFLFLAGAFSLQNRWYLWAGIISMTFIGLLVWTILSEQNQPLKASNQTSSMVFPVALLQKHCDHVDASELEASFANPHSLVLISFLAPVVFAIYEMLVHLMKLQSCVTKSAGSGVSACVKSVVACAKMFILCKCHFALHKCFGYIPSKVQTRLPADLEESASEEIEAAVDEKAADLTEQSRGAIED